MEGEQKEPIRVPLGNGEKMVFCHVPAGSFRMGERGKDPREEPVTEVFVEEFWMAENPVTRGQYALLAEGCLDQLEKEDGNRGIEPEPIKNPDDAKRPVSEVNWHEARIVANWLTTEMQRLGKLPTGYRVDLPWESQWEKACRWGTETEYHSGDGEAALAEVGWFDEDWAAGPFDVRSKPANGGGMSDWHGSVWQWCLDSWDGERADSRLQLPGEAEPDVRGEEDYRVLRGGSWGFTAGYCRSACRVRFGPGCRFRSFGFRLALVPGSGDEGEAGGRESGAEPRREQEGGTPDPATGGGGAVFAEATAAEADLNATFPPRSGGDFLNENKDQE